jgi:hypothetical protein
MLFIFRFGLFRLSNTFQVSRMAWIAFGGIMIFLFLSYLLEYPGLIILGLVRPGPVHSPAPSSATATRPARPSWPFRTMPPSWLLPTRSKSVETTPAPQTLQCTPYSRSTLRTNGLQHALHHIKSCVKMTHSARILPSNACRKTQRIQSFVH